MIRITFSLADFRQLTQEMQIDLISFCLRVIGNENNRIVIDNQEIGNRDDFFNWQIDNQIVFPKPRQ